MPFATDIVCLWAQAAVLLILVLWLAVVTLLDPVSMTCSQPMPRVMQPCLCDISQSELLPTFFFVFFIGKWLNIFSNFKN